MYSCFRRIVMILDALDSSSSARDLHVPLVRRGSFPPLFLYIFLFVGLGVSLSLIVPKIGIPAGERV